MPCRMKETMTEERIGMYLEGRLSPEEAGAVEAHLAGCDACRALLGTRPAEGDEARPIPSNVAARAGRVIAEHTRTPKTTTLFTIGRMAAVAACLAIIAGSLVYNHRSSSRFTSVLVARIEETAPDVEIVRGEKTVFATLHMPVYAGDRIVTGPGRNATVVYEGEDTEIVIDENTQIDIGDVREGKRLGLASGVIDASVDPQPEGMPFVVTTPHAEAIVVGTVFELSVVESRTRLEVYEGTVRLARTVRGEQVHVSAGRYAVARDDTTLLAGSIMREQGGRTPNWSRNSFRHLVGKTIFEDEFDTMDNWEVIVGTEGGETAVVADPAPYATLETDFPQTKHSGTVIPLASCLILDHRGEPGRTVRIRSRKPVTSDRFLIELHAGVAPTNRGKRNTTRIFDEGIEITGDDIVEMEVDYGVRDPQIGRGMGIARWECIRIGAASRDDLWYYRAWHRSGLLLRSCYARPSSTHITFGIGGAGRKLVIDRVVVREIRKE